MEFRRSLVWHSAAHSTKIKLQTSAWGFKKPTTENLSKAVPATLQTQACTLNNEGNFTTPDEYRKELHICPYCLVSAKRQCAHQQRFCGRKMYDGAKY